MEFSEGNSENALECIEHYPEPYTGSKGAHFEGSGGASGGGSTNTGGSGGGIIRMSAMNTMTLTHSDILANGMPGERQDTATGSGGGAGGSISLVARNLNGHSRIEAKGGEGSTGGGGGGSGGLLLINFLTGFSAASQPE